MILPIVAYGDPILKKEAEEIKSDYPGLKDLIEDMFETMYEAQGIGLVWKHMGAFVEFMKDWSMCEKGTSPGWLELFAMIWWKLRQVDVAE